VSLTSSRLALATCVLLSGAGAALAQVSKGEIAEVQVVGGTTISAETVEYYLGVTVGDPFDAAAIAGNFHRFWDSGLVEELTVESEEVSPGKFKVIVTVRERPKVSEWDFQGNKKLSDSTLREKLDTAGVTMRRNTPLRMSEVQRYKQAVRDVYAADGYASAKVEPVIEEVGAVTRKVVFHVDEGAKIKIGAITFEGNEVYSDRALRGSLKKLKQKSVYRMFGKKVIWSKESWGEDSENVKKYYMNRGYKDILVGEPKVELIAKHPEAETQKEKGFRMEVSIPVQEGKRFRLGKLEIKGSSVFDTTKLRRLYEVDIDGRYKHSAIEAGNEAVRNLYQSRGYIYAYTNQVAVDSETEADVTNVVIDIYEGGRYRLGRIEFTGNAKTQEKVMRREFRIFEGDWMDMGAFRKSVFKVNQLGFFKLTDDPLEFKFDDENKLVNVTVKGQEVGRSDIQFGAGYSEIDHFFAQLIFNTRNFLGRGEVLGVSISSGSRQDTYSLSFTEPYFMDRRMVIGGSIYKQKTTLDDYYRDSQGGSIVWGFSPSFFGQFSLVYGYDDAFVRYTTTRTLAAGQGPGFPHQRPLDPPYADAPFPELFFDEYTGVTSSITPSLVYDSRDDPFDPSQGLTYFGRLRVAGGFLGGDFNYVRPELGATIFHPLTRRYILAGNFEAGQIFPFADSEIPIYDRYRLGGERSLRGFEYYSVLPRTAIGTYFVTAAGAREGGDRYAQLNLEFQIKLGGPIKLILFSDIGNTWHEKQGWKLDLWRYSAGAELRIFLPMFQAPLRFIYGVNLDPFPDEQGTDFQFSIGTTF
jgi:outer membrane protein insertion porin family